MKPELTNGATLVLGGARSGKSRFSEGLILNSSHKPVYIATGRALDEEMSERIAIHQERRGSDWQTVEEPLALVDAIRTSAHPGHAILVDCLSLWVTNLMMANTNIEKEFADLADMIGGLEIPIVLVSNEVGLGVISDNEMARRFVDLTGTLHQKIATRCDAVYFVAAGLPMKLKG